MVSIHRPLGYGPSTLPLRHSALHFPWWIWTHVSIRPLGLMLMLRCVSAEIRKKSFDITDSRGWFRSIDLWVMGPARFRCATLLWVVLYGNLTYNLYIRTLCKTHTMYTYRQNATCLWQWWGLNPCLERDWILNLSEWVSAEDGFSPSPFGLRAQYASIAPLCWNIPQMGFEPTIPGLGGQCLIH